MSDSSTYPKNLKAIKATLLSLPFLFLNSCLVGPDYEAPHMQVPSAFRGAPSYEESIANLPWWKVVKGQNLQNLLVEAYQNNRDLRATIANVDSARQYIQVAAAPIFPFLDYGANTSRANTTGTKISASTGASLAASWELDIWGKTRRGIEAAEAEFAGADHLMRSLQLSLLRQVSTGYLQLLMLDEQLRISRQAVTSYRKSLDLFQVRLEGGIGNKLEVESATAALAAAEAQIPDIESQIIALENSISVMVGRTPGGITRGSDTLGRYVNSSSVPSGVPANILANRPDVLAAEQNVRVANANIGIAIANFFPSVNLTAGYGLASPQLLSFNNSNDSWNFAAGLTGPLFRAGVLSSGKKIAYNNLKAQLASYENTVLYAMAEVATTLTQRAKLRQIISKQEKAVTAARQSLETSLSLFQNGVANYYEVLQAQQQLFPSELQLAVYRYQYAATVPTLYTQLGGGWKNSHKEIRQGAEDTSISKKQEN